MADSAHPQAEVVLRSPLPPKQILAAYKSTVQQRGWRLLEGWDGWNEKDETEGVHRCVAVFGIRSRKDADPSMVLGLRLELALRWHQEHIAEGVTEVEVFVVEDDWYADGGGKIGSLIQRIAFSGIPGGIFWAYTLMPIYAFW